MKRGSLLEGWRKTSPIPPPFLKPCNNHHHTNNCSCAKVVWTQPKFFSVNLVHCGDKTHEESITASLLFCFEILNDRSGGAGLGGRGDPRGSKRVRLDEEIIWGSNKLTRWEGQLTLEEDKPKDGEEVDKDECEDEGEDDGAEISRDSTDHILQCLLPEDHLH